MVITHCISTIDKKAGGPSRSVPILCDSVASVDRIVNLLYYDSAEPNVENIVNPYFSCINVEKEKNIFSFNNYINKLKECKSDIIQIHNLWTPILHYVSRFARKNHIPYIITPRGTLDPWALESKYYKKRLALLLYQLDDLKNATCVHVTSMAEAQAIRNLGINTPLALISNSIAVEKYPEKDYQKESKKKILFLSRIHPKKGIEQLIKTWSILPDKIKEEWTLDIVGNYEDESYYKSLKLLVEENKISQSIKFESPLFGDKKIKKYHEADIFILPSYDENFGMVIAEALVCGVPVITTKGTPWEELIIHKCGWWIDDNSVNNIMSALKDAMSMSKEELSQMGRRGRNLILSKYSSNIISQKMQELYDWIYAGVKKPEFII